MTTTELRNQLKALEAERAAAAEWGLADVPAYMNDLDDEITRGCLITKDGDVVNDRVREALERAPATPDAGSTP